MSRRCLCARLFTAFRADPRLRSLPWATRAFFLLLGEAMAGSENPGVLGFGSVSRVSLLVSVPETEVETQMETLLAEGLLARTEAGGLACPLLLGPPPRQAAAQENGRKGGRPRRGETPEAARARRSQGTLALPIAGGAAETQAKPSAETPTTTTTTTTGNSNSLSLVRSSLPPAHVALGEEVAVLAGLDPVAQRFDFVPVRAWLADGLTPAEIREGVRRVVTRPGYVPGRITTLRYFDRSVREMQGAAPSAAATAAGGFTAPEGPSPLELAIEAWNFGGRRGAPPRAADFHRLSA